MNGVVEAALIDAEGAGQIARLGDLGTFTSVSDEIIGLAETPFAPLAASALAAAAAAAPDMWSSTTASFASSLGAQRSVLALLDTLDVLLDGAASATASAGALHSALLADHDDLAHSAPQLAAARIEGALRIALTDVVPPYLVFHHLTNVDPNLPEAYTEAMPRLLGAALDRWDTDVRLTAPLISALLGLRASDAADASATFELACQRMRTALREEDPSAAGAGLAAAAEAFAEANSLDESRDDAAVYRAVCAAVAAFGRSDGVSLGVAVADLDAVMRRRFAWNLNAHEPPWRRPVLDAEVEWLRLVLDLRDASERLTEPSWLEAAAAVGQLSRAYAAERATAPAPGLIAIVRPVIENAVAANAVLLEQMSRALEADRRRDLPLLPPSSELLRDGIRARRAAGPAPTADRGTSDDADEEGDPGVLDSRIEELASDLKTVVGTDIARVIGRAADDLALAQLGEILTIGTTSGIAEHPTLRDVRRDILHDLEANPRFEGETRAAVIALLNHTLTFLLNRYDRGGPLLPGATNILRLLQKDETPPLEKELQAEYAIWLENSHQFAGRVECETPDIATGRVDVIVRLGEIKLVTEVKRELKDPSRETLNQYRPQAAAYSGSNVPFSQLLVLDLTDHTNGVAPLKDLAWVYEHRARTDSSPQHVVAAVVPGNRPTPSQLKPNAPL